MSGCALEPSIYAIKPQEPSAGCASELSSTAEAAAVPGDHSVKEAVRKYAEELVAQPVVVGCAAVCGLANDYERIERLRARAWYIRHRAPDAQRWLRIRALEHC